MIGVVTIGLVKVTVKARKVTVTGPRGTITKDLAHMQIDIRIMKMATKKQKGLYIRIQMWNGKYKHACGVTTIKSLINNMIIGTTQVSVHSVFLLFYLFNYNTHVFF